jgi:hypothetical protein
MESVLYTKRELAGLGIASIPAVFILGTSKPLLTESISRIALASGVVVPIPTLSCAEALLDPNADNMKESPAIAQLLKNECVIRFSVYKANLSIFL